MAWVENIAPMFADFAVAATFSGGTKQAIFDNGYAGAFAGMVPDTDPRLTCRTSDVSAVAVGDSVTVNAVAYTVCAIEPDGTGITILRLK